MVNILRSCPLMNDFIVLECTAANSCGSFSFTTGVRTSLATHTIRAFHCFSLPVLRQRLLNDGRTFSLQHRLPAHEREGKDRLMQRNTRERFPRLQNTPLWCKGLNGRFGNLHTGTWTVKKKKDFFFLGGGVIGTLGY